MGNFDQNTAIVKDANTIGEVLVCFIGIAANGVAQANRFLREFHRLIKVSHPEQNIGSGGGKRVGGEPLFADDSSKLIRLRYVRCKLIVLTHQSACPGCNVVSIVEIEV